MIIKTFRLRAKNMAAAVVLTFVASGEKMLLPIYSVETEEPEIAISFDAAWGADDTDTLLEILEDNDVKTTFFMCGYWIDKYPDEVKKIAEAGHDLGNHSATHPHMSKLTKEQIADEIKDTGNKIEELTGVKSELFRAPFGEYTNDVISTAEELGYYTIQWDVEGLDTKLKTTFSNQL